MFLRVGSFSMLRALSSYGRCCSYIFDALRYVSTDLSLLAFFFNKFVATQVVDSTCGQGDMELKRIFVLQKREGGFMRSAYQFADFQTYPFIPRLLYFLGLVVFLM
uniref:Uncharacterized protein n=1 Tax=Parascaris univalens TaxID=6257 RepID=A0A915BN76_PARUN